MLGRHVHLKPVSKWNTIEAPRLIRSSVSHSHTDEWQSGSAHSFS